MPRQLTGPAAHALSAAIAAVEGDGHAAATPALELAGEVIDLCDGTYGLLAVYGGDVVRITIGPARPEEAAAILGGALETGPDEHPATYADFEAKVAAAAAADAEVEYQLWAERHDGEPRDA
jgi:hypothetical protein